MCDAYGRQIHEGDEVTCALGCEYKEIPGTGIPIGTLISGTVVDMGAFSVRVRSSETSNGWKWVWWVPPKVLAIVDPEVDTRMNFNQNDFYSMLGVGQ